MPVIFSGNTGRVSAITDAVAAGALALVAVNGDTPISARRHKTIITRVGLSAAGNFQFLHTIGNDVYTYVFGDRMGQIDVHGLSFSTACESGGKHGFELLYQWYKQNRIAVNKKPVIVTIGRETSFQGFVTALTGDVQDSMHRTIQFQMSIATLPTV